MDDNDINGQYYEVDDKSYSQARQLSTTYNCLRNANTNLEKIKNEFNFINYEKEQILDESPNGSESHLKGYSNKFNVSRKSRYFNPNNNRIVAHVRLKERDKFSLTVKKDINKYKIALSNGQIFKQYNFDENNEYHKLRLFNITLDTQLSYGAKLYVEYKITVTNNSNIDCTGYTLLNRFENLEYDENQYLLSNINENNGDKWAEIKKEKVKDLLGIEDSTNTMTYLKLEDNGLAAGTEECYYITLTRPLDAEDGSTIFNGMSELIEYKNNEGRRNYNNTNLTGDVMNGVIKASNYVTVGEEADTAFSEDIAILPPTGFDIKTLCLLMISSVICLIGFKYLISKKLYLNVKKSKLKRKWNKF